MMTMKLRFSTLLILGTVSINLSQQHDVKGGSFSGSFSSSSAASQSSSFSSSSSGSFSGAGSFGSNEISNGFKNLLGKFASGANAAAGSSATTGFGPTLSGTPTNNFGVGGSYAGSGSQSTNGNGVGGSKVVGNVGNNGGYGGSFGSSGTGSVGASGDNSKNINNQGSVGFGGGAGTGEGTTAEGGNSNVSGSKSDTTSVSGSSSTSGSGTFGVPAGTTGAAEPKPDFGQTSFGGNGATSGSGGFGFGSSFSLSGGIAGPGTVTSSSDNTDKGGSFDGQSQNTDKVVPVTEVDQEGLSTPPSEVKVATWSPEKGTIGVIPSFSSTLVPVKPGESDTNPTAESVGSTFEPATIPSKSQPDRGYVTGTTFSSTGISSSSASSSGIATSPVASVGGSTKPFRNGGGYVTGTVGATGENYPGPTSVSTFYHHGSYPKPTDQSFAFGSVPFKGNKGFTKPDNYEPTFHKVMPGHYDGTGYCCNGPFPGPDGSIHHSKPASSVPPIPVATGTPSQGNSKPTFSVPKETPNVGNAGPCCKGPFPGPNESIHKSKPASSVPSIFGSYPFPTPQVTGTGNGASSGTTASGSSTTVAKGPCCKGPFPGPNLGIHHSVPASSIPKVGPGNRPSGTYSGMVPTAGAAANANSGSQPTQFDQGPQYINSYHHGYTPVKHIMTNYDHNPSVLSTDLNPPAVGGSAYSKSGTTVVNDGSTPDFTFAGKTNLATSGSLGASTEVPTDTFSIPAQKPQSPTTFETKTPSGSYGGASAGTSSGTISNQKEFGSGLPYVPGTYSTTTNIQKADGNGFATGNVVVQNSDGTVTDITGPPSSGSRGTAPSSISGTVSGGGGSFGSYGSSGAGLFIPSGYTPGHHGVKGSHGYSGSASPSYFGGAHSGASAYSGASSYGGIKGGGSYASAGSSAGSGFNGVLRNLFGKHGLGGNLGGSGSGAGSGAFASSSSFAGAGSYSGHY